MLFDRAEIVPERDLVAPRITLNDLIPHPSRVQPYLGGCIRGAV